MGSIPSKLLANNGNDEFRSQFLFSYVIGKGGFGKVSSAMHIESKEWCAMKEINIHQLMKHKNGLAMLMTELSAHQQIDNHQFIVNMKSAFHDNKICYMSFDLCVGGDLRYHLRKGHLFNEEATAFVVACIGSALHHIHGKGIIHRDVKPENIILDDYGFVLLADFGVAHVNSMDSSNNHNNNHSHMDNMDDEYCYKCSGTKQYLAPEVFTKSHKHTYSADFWSLGIVAYELIHGVRPFAKHCPLTFVQYLEKKEEKKNGFQLIEEMHDDFCTFHRYPFACNCRSLSDCCITNREGRPCVYLPEISRINGIISTSCLRVLAGLLNVEPTLRYGHGDSNYLYLINDSWYEEHQMTWDEIVDGEIAPPFSPDLREVSLDICKRYIDDTSSSSPSPDNLQATTSAQQCRHCNCHCLDISSLCLHCRPLPLPTEVRNVLNQFYYVSSGYEKYAHVTSSDLLLSQTSYTTTSSTTSASASILPYPKHPTITTTATTTRIPIRRTGSSSQVHISS